MVRNTRRRVYSLQLAVTNSIRCTTAAIYIHYTSPTSVCLSNHFALIYCATVATRLVSAITKPSTALSQRKFSLNRTILYAEFEFASTMKSTQKYFRVANFFCAVGLATAQNVRDEQQKQYIAKK